MPTQIQKSFQEYLSKIKISNKQIQLRLKSSRRTKAPSLSSDCGGGSRKDPVTFSGVDQFLVENFSSLYQEELEEDTLKGQTISFPFDSPKLIGSPPPENLCGSARFFVAAGSSSSLITDEAFSSSTSAFTTGSSAPEKSEQNVAAEEPEPQGDFVAILTYSPSPYEDFRLSMQEMVAARVEQEGEVDWEFMEELLFCYLDLNNKSSYRFILHAFVDLVVVLHGDSGRIPASSLPWSGGGGRRRMKGEK
ncbi:Ovate family protein 14 [Dorcoceras hygrometricum]|uniref:Transcription repressor n=1 Tax=Dorcoceras hygrometricum TaxID=472368 RepID=A0A2Z7DFE9_9LAMI|nr:Ovate family protein 14 [Dorcoceras hygrometricum]